MNAVLRRWPAVLLAAAVASSVAALAALAPGSPLASSCAAAGSNHAALVVEHGDGSVVTRCVAFASATVTGQQLLDSSGVAWSGESFGGFGEAVCSVDSEPAHYSVCPGKDNYWAVFVSRGGAAWQLASVGISTLTLGPGDAEGLRYVPAVGDPVAPPAPAGVCAAAAASAGATAAATSAATAVATVVATTQASGASTSAPATASAGCARAPTPVPATNDVVSLPSVSASPVSEAPRPDATLPAGRSGSGLDPGLLAAALAGGGLAGLALLRLAIGRRAP
jgi:hypothetical protein